MTDDAARPPYEPGDYVNVLYLQDGTRALTPGGSPPLTVATDRPVVAVLWSPIDGMWHLSIDLPDDTARSWDGHYAVTPDGVSPHVRPADPGDCPGCLGAALCTWHEPNALQIVSDRLGGTVAAVVPA